MWERPTRCQARGVVGLVRQGRKDCTLVATCGGRVPTHTLLLALHSPTLAALLHQEDRDNRAISLPFPLATLTSLVNCLYEGWPAGSKEVEEAADLLDISIQPNPISISIFAKKVEAEKFKIEEGDRVAGLELESTALSSKKILASPKLEVEYDDYEGSYEMVEDNFDDVDSQSTETTPSKKKRGRPKKVLKEEEDNSEDEDHTNKGTPGKEKPFKCDICGMAYQKDTGKKAHMLLKHNIDILCDQCDKSFTVAKRYRKHMDKDHPEGEFVCTVCGDKKANKQKLDFHIESNHSDGVSCHFCGNHYKTKAACNEHVRRKHEGREEFQCEKCEFKSTVKGVVKKHFISFHTEQLNEPCIYCGEVFKEMKRHIERMHGSQEGIERKKVPCDMCEKTFSDGNNMRDHMKKVHSGRKDEKCELCAYATYSKYNLKLHVAKVHLGTGLVKQSCPHCDKETTNLAHHIKMYHQLEV